MNYSWKSYQLKLNQPFVLSYGSFSERTSFIIELAEGINVGLGEATAISYYGWTEEKIQLELTRLEQEINSATDCERILTKGNLSSPVRNALQSAYVDLRARQREQNLIGFYNLAQVREGMRSSITISGNHYHDIKPQIDKYDWPIYKIKMTGNSDDEKFQIIKDHSSKLFRIDANAGWDMDWVSSNIENLNLSNIELIEQPFKTNDQHSMADLKKLVQKPFYADESCQSIDDIRSCATHFDGVNIKLMKCGGWDKAIDMIELARSLNMQVMLGCMTETSVGISHAIQLLGIVDIADVDGSFLISNDPARGSCLKKGKIVQADGWGSGADLIGQTDQ